MKALELTVYPKLVPPRFHYGSDNYVRQWKREQAIIHAKRFTDAELAADYWGLRAMVDEAQLLHGTLNPEGVRVRGQVDTLLRFATLPHYDEADQ